MNINEQRKALFLRSYNVSQEIITLQDDLREIKGEFEYHKEYNVKGLPKEVVKLIMKAASAKAKQDNLKEKAQELIEIDELISELE